MASPDRMTWSERGLVLLLGLALGGGLAFGVSLWMDQDREASREAAVSAIDDALAEACAEAAEPLRAQAVALEAELAEAVETREALEADLAPVGGVPSYWEDPGSVVERRDALRESWTAAMQADAAIARGYVDCDEDPCLAIVEVATGRPADGLQAVAQAAGSPVQDVVVVEGSLAVGAVGAPGEAGSARAARTERRARRLLAASSEGP